MFARLRRKGRGEFYGDPIHCARPSLPLLGRRFDADTSRYIFLEPTQRTTAKPLSNRDFLELHYSSVKFQDEGEVVYAINLESCDTKQLHDRHSILLCWLHEFGGLDTTGCTAKVVGAKSKLVVTQYSKLVKNYNARRNRGGSQQWEKLQEFLDAEFTWAGRTHGTKIVKHSALSKGAAPCERPVDTPPPPPPSYEEVMKSSEMYPQCSSSLPVPSVSVLQQRKPLGESQPNIVTTKTRSGTPMPNIAEVQLKRKAQRLEKANQVLKNENNSLKKLVGSRLRQVAQERDKAVAAADMKVQNIVKASQRKLHMETSKLHKQLQAKEDLASKWQACAEDLMDSCNENNNEENKERRAMERKVERQEAKMKVLRKELKVEKKRLKKAKDQVQSLEERIRSAEENLEQGQEAAEVFYEGIIEELEKQTDRSANREEQLQKRVQELSSLETMYGKTYTAQVRLTYYHLLTLGVSSNIIKDVVKSVLDNLTQIDMDGVSLPGRTTAQRLKIEAGHLATIKGLKEWEKRGNKEVAYQSDHTTRGQLHWLSHKVILRQEEGGQGDRVFSLALAPVCNETADKTVQHLIETFEEMGKVADTVGVDSSFLNVSTIKTHMKDRAVVEQRVTSLLEDKKGAILEAGVEWENLGEEEQARRKKIYPFTCAAHKVQNTAEAMSAAAQKHLNHAEDATAGRRGMVGGKGHIYATDKLICMESKKEYCEGKELRGFSLAHEELDASCQKLFQPIVGNRFLAFYHNAIPCIAGKDLIMLYLTDKRLQKGTLNRLETAVYNGYLDPKIISEERSYSILYYEVLLPLYKKAIEAPTPIAMNRYYQTVYDKLLEWSEDAQPLFEGSDPLWGGGRDENLKEYLQLIRQPQDTDTLTKTTLQEMCKAGAAKLKAHAHEHMAGGEYASPSEEQIDAAKLIGDATNLRVEQDFGILAQQQVVSPSANPLTHSCMVRCKQDKPASWLASQPRDEQEKLCATARKGAKRLKTMWGTKEEQLKKSMRRRNQGGVKERGKDKQVTKERWTRKDSWLRLCQKADSSQTIAKYQT
ncbi:uncharacterized protein LOC144859840 [Branchiostoma floridae x Branchiostoma japonicum]